MKILLCAPHWAMATGRHVCMALERLGHDVKTVGPCQRDKDGFAVWEPDLEPVPFLPPAQYLQSFPADVALAYFKLMGWVPDMILSVLGTFALSGKTPMPHVFYSVEPDSYTNHYDIDGAKERDFLFLNDLCSKQWGAPDVHYLASGYDPTIHINRVPYEERPIQLVLGGNHYDERNYFMSMLGMQFRAFYAWGLSWEQFVTLYNAGMVSLSLPGTKGISPQRTFETLAMGCLLLSRPMPDFERLGLVADVHYLPFNDLSEAQAQMRRVVYTERDVWRPMRAAVDEWIGGHTWDVRCEEIIRVVCGA